MQWQERCARQQAQALTDTHDVPVPLVQLMEMNVLLPVARCPRKRKLRQAIDERPRISRERMPRRGPVDDGRGQDGSEVHGIRDERRTGRGVVRG